MIITRALFLTSFSIAVGFADMDHVMAENNLEKRSELAMKNAHEALDRSRQAYQHRNDDEDQKALDEVARSVELCKESLDQSGKNPRRSPKYFKRAEIELRKLIRRLDSFRIERGVDDREPIDKLLEQSHRIHEELIAGIMGKKK
jgi:hypothetical protein